MRMFNTIEPRLLSAIMVMKMVCLAACDRGGLSLLLKFVGFVVVQIIISACFWVGDAKRGGYLWQNIITSLNWARRDGVFSLDVNFELQPRSKPYNSCLWEET
jgi:hypothetical protein